MSSYRVVVEGSTLPGFAIDAVRPRLAALVNQPEAVAARLLSGQPSTVKSGVDQTTGTRYVNAITAIGVACRLEREALEIDITDPLADTSIPKAVQSDMNVRTTKAETSTLKRPQKGVDEKYCSDCGSVINAKAEICPNCGVRQMAPSGWGAQGEPVSPSPQVTPQRKWSPGVAAVLSLVIPGAGQMYKGKVGSGLLWLIFVIIGYAAMIVPGVILHLICIFNAATGDPTK